ncbi:MAG: pilus assembly protein CpaD [Sphingomonas sp.]|nr:pilus assembly protein CpaD [Sphingomonas sp.]
MTVLGLGAAACAPTTGPLSATNNPSIYSVHQPIVQRTDFVFDVAVAGNGVSAGELDRLDGWFRSIGLRYGDSIAVDEGTGYAAPNARADVARVAARYGLLLADGAPVTAGAVPAGSVRVVASRSTANVPGCPNWDAEGNGMLAPQGTSSNFGCAVNSNLAAMIANPDDLVVGRDASANGTGRTASRAIRVYREGQPTGTQGLQQTSTTQGGNQ